MKEGIRLKIAHLGISVEYNSERLIGDNHMRNHMQKITS